MRSESTNTVLSGAEYVLSSILNSRLQRQAKSIILSCLECLIVFFGILSTTLSSDDIKNKSVGSGLQFAVILGALYVAFLAIFLFIHSSMFLKVKSMQTEQRIEDAYGKSNSLPFGDGVVELVYPYKFKGNYWYLSYITWGVWTITTFLSCCLLYIARDELSATDTSSFSAAFLLFYQVTSDFSEYWTKSRHRESSTTDINVSESLV